MFFLILRELFLWAAVLVVIWWLWTKIITVIRKDARKEYIRQRLQSIEVLEELSETPDVDGKRLERAREKLRKIQKEGSSWL